VACGEGRRGVGVRSERLAVSKKTRVLKLRAGVKEETQ